MKDEQKQQKWDRKVGQDTAQPTQTVTDWSVRTAASLADAYWAIWEHQALLLQLEADIAKAMFKPSMPGMPLPDLGKRFTDLQSSTDKVIARMRYLTDLAIRQEASLDPGRDKTT